MLEMADLLKHKKKWENILKEEKDEAKKASCQKEIDKLQEEANYIYFFI